MPKAKKRTVKMWGGIVDGRLHTSVYRAEGSGYDEHEHASIFAKRYEVRAQFECVVPVTVTYTLPSRPKQRKRR